MRLRFWSLGLRSLNFSSLKCAVMALGLLAASCGEVNFTEDAASPVFLSKFVHINDGAEYTRDQQVQLSLQGGFAVEMFISSTPDCRTGRWEPFAPTRDYRLPQTNSKVSVYVKFRAEKNSKKDDQDTNSPKGGTPKGGTPEGSGAEENEAPDERACYAASIIHDNRPPQISLSKNQASQVVPTNKVELNFEAQDTGSGLEQVQCAKGQRGRYGPCATDNQALFADLEDGQHVFRIRARDKAGNEKVQSYTRVVDTQAPEIKWLSKLTPLQAVKNIEFKVQAHDATTKVVKLQCRRGVRGGWRVCEETVNLRNLIDGEHTFAVRAIDEAGHTSPVLSHTWRVDTKAPVLSINTAKSVSSIVNNNRARVVFSATDTRADGSKGKIQYLCQHGRGEGKSKGQPDNFKACPSPFDLQNLSDGLNYVLIKAVDEAGNTSPVKLHRWRVDMQAPEVVINTQQSVKSLVNTSAAQVVFTAHDTRADNSVSRLKLLCQVNHATFKVCSSPFRVNWLTDGQHTVWIKAVDEAGNTSPVEKHIWRIDTKKPVLNIDVAQSPPAISQKTSGRVVFAATDARADGSASTLQYLCRQGRGDVPVDTSGFKPCEAGLDVQELVDGQNYVLVQAVDEAGNRSDIQKHVWRVDTVAPVVKLNLNQSVKAEVNTPQAQIAFDVHDKRADGSSSTLTLLCQHEAAGEARAGEFQPCQSPWGLTRLRDGVQMARVKAVDEAGNTSPVQEHRWRVDTRAPVVKIDQLSSVALLVNSSSAKVFFEATDERADASSSELSLLCRLGETGDFKTCQSPYQLNNLKDGVRRVEIKAVDVAGNESYVQTHKWRVDTRVPVLNIDATRSVAAITNKTSARVLFEATDTRADGSASSVEYLCLHGLNWKSGPINNTAPSVKPASTQIDNSRPTGTQPAGTQPAGTQQSKNNDSPLFQSCQAPFELNNVADGENYVLVQAIDEAGNKSEIQKHLWRVDTRAPEVSIDVAQSVAAITNKTSARIVFTGTDTRVDGSTSPLKYVCTHGLNARSYPMDTEEAPSSSLQPANSQLANSKLFQDCRDAFELNNVADGENYVLVQAIDEAGNKSAMQKHIWRVDTIAPEVVIDTERSVKAITNQRMARVAFRATDARSDGSTSKLKLQCYYGSGTHTKKSSRIKINSTSSLHRPF